MGRLLAVNETNYTVRAPVCNSGDMTFPQALGALREALGREEQTRVCGEDGSGTSRRGWLLPPQQEGQKSDTGENFLTLHGRPFQPRQLGLLKEQHCFPHTCRSPSVVPREAFGPPGKEALPEKAGSWA